MKVVGAENQIQLTCAEIPDFSRASMGAKQPYWKKYGCSLVAQLHPLHPHLHDTTLLNTLESFCQIFHFYMWKLIIYFPYWENLNRQKLKICLTDCRNKFSSSHSCAWQKSWIAIKKNKIGGDHSVKGSFTNDTIDSNGGVMKCQFY